MFRETHNDIKVSNSVLIKITKKYNCPEIYEKTNAIFCNIIQFFFLSSFDFKTIKQINLLTQTPNLRLLRVLFNILLIQIVAFFFFCPKYLFKQNKLILTLRI